MAQARRSCGAAAVLSSAGSRGRGRARRSPESPPSLTAALATRLCAAHIHSPRLRMWRLARTRTSPTAARNAGGSQVIGCNCSATTMHSATAAAAAAASLTPVAMRAVTITAASLLACRAVSQRTLTRAYRSPPLTTRPPPPPPRPPTPPLAASWQPPPRAQPSPPQLPPPPFAAAAPPVSLVHRLQQQLAQARDLPTRLMLVFTLLSIAPWVALLRTPRSRRRLLRLLLLIGICLALYHEGWADWALRRLFDAYRSGKDAQFDAWVLRRALDGGSASVLSRARRVGVEEHPRDAIVEEMLAKEKLLKQQQEADDALQPTAFSLSDTSRRRALQQTLLHSWAQLGVGSPSDPMWVAAMQAAFPRSPPIASRLPPPVNAWFPRIRGDEVQRLCRWLLLKEPNEPAAPVAAPATASAAAAGATTPSTATSTVSTAAKSGEQSLAHEFQFTPIKGGEVAVRADSAWDRSFARACGVLSEFMSYRVALAYQVLAEVEWDAPDRMGVRAHKMGGFKAARWWLEKALHFAEEGGVTPVQQIQLRQRIMRMWIQADSPLPADLCATTQSLLDDLINSTEDASSAKGPDFSWREAQLLLSSFYELRAQSSQKSKRFAEATVNWNHALQARQRIRHAEQLQLESASTALLEPVRTEAAARLRIQTQISHCALALVDPWLADARVQHAAAIAIAEASADSPPPEPLPASPTPAPAETTTAPLPASDASKPAPAAVGLPLDKLKPGTAEYLPGIDLLVAKLRANAMYSAIGAVESSCFCVHTGNSACLRCVRRLPHGEQIQFAYLAKLQHPSAPVRATPVAPSSPPPPHLPEPMPGTAVPALSMAEGVAVAPEAPAHDLGSRFHSSGDGSVHSASDAPAAVDRFEPHDPIDLMLACPLPYAARSRCEFFLLSNQTSDSTDRDDAASTTTKTPAHKWPMLPEVEFSAKDAAHTPTPTPAWRPLSFVSNVWETLSSPVSHAIRSALQMHAPRSHPAFPELTPVQLLQLQVDLTKSMEQLSRALHANGDSHRAKAAADLAAQSANVEWIRPLLPRQQNDPPKP